MREVEAPLRRFEVELSTTFLVTQAQRDLLQAQVNLLQATLDYQSSLVMFEALQLAPAVSGGNSVSVSGSAIQPIATPNPQGIFRTAPGGFHDSCERSPLRSSCVRARRADGGRGRDPRKAQ